MSAADDLRLVARLRSDAPFSEHGHLYTQAANAIEDANARVALAHADALNAAADALGGDWSLAGNWLRRRAVHIEVGTI